MSDTMSPSTTTPSLPLSSSATSRTSTPNVQADLSEREKRRAQNRENLRAHYGLQGKKADAEEKPSHGVQVEGDPLDPDSPAFSPEKYYKHLITTASLPQLLRESVTLSADVKNLNSSRHALVYNHHHQLFAAGDTISTLNAKTPQLQVIVNSLQERFDEISKLVENVSFPMNQPHSTEPSGHGP